VLGNRFAVAVKVGMVAVLLMTSDEKVLEVETWMVYLAIG